ncbi:MAG: hypothetical protein KJ886_04285 [Candidatus Thermoplasmatota archaeon]|nr:hypothetical protein [Candidatus Thermoplasmatota archaeon]MCG2735492.1 hypothetical protein [Candidatus Methanoperedenaceae archaeon]
MEKREIETDDDDMNSNENAGLIIGHYCRPKNQGYDYVLLSCEDDGRGDRMLSKVKKFKGKKAYFYIFESYENKPNDLKLNDWEQFKESNGEKLGRIFGEGLIKEVKNKKIIYQYVTHYLDYIDINEANILLERIDEINKNKPVKSQKSVKQRITIGLPLTKDECDQISSLAGIR